MSQTSNMNPTLLIEIGAEELPPKALPRLSQAFCSSIAQGLIEAGLEIGEVQPYATPRRLAVSIADVAPKASDQAIEKLGPALDKAFGEDGQPTPAALGFARSCGVTVDELQQRETDKGKRLAYEGIEAGQSLAQLLPAVMETTLKTLPIPKRMRWGAGQALFVRPVHWVVALHGSEVLGLKLFDCDADRITYGHRFHCGQPIPLEHADDYADRLLDPGHVVADFDVRRARVLEQVREAALQKQGQALIDDALLDEVTALVEWPVAITGNFDSGFLTLPREALIATLQGHQRYFPVVDTNDKLLPCFITVANLQSKDPAQVVTGNERVVRPRLSDALFFWNTDLERGLDSYAKELGGVSFERSLGSLSDKSQRVAQLAKLLAETLNVDTRNVSQAAELAKADLLSEMVGEFPELQGTMGRYYALAADIDPGVAQALEDQYAPRQSGAAIPAGDVGRVLALADKLDTLAGIFAIGKRPSGDKDPYALRRAALGVLRIIIEAELVIDLDSVTELAINNQPIKEDKQEIKSALKQFLLERLRAYLIDQGISYSVFDAVASLGFTQPLDFIQRTNAVRGFLNEPEASNLCAAHKRIRNILKNSEIAENINPELLSEDAEKQLYATLVAKRDEVKGHVEQQDYSASLHSLAELQHPVDEFFDQVMVMSDDPIIKTNRLALLHALDSVCRQVADISKLSVD